MRAKRHLAAVVAVLLVGCTSQTVPPTLTAAPTASPTPATTFEPTAAPTQAPAQSPGSEVGVVVRLYCCATDPRSLRPQAASGSDELSIINGMQRGLLYRDAEGDLVPELAIDLPTISPDLLTYTYRLRPDAKYSDGTPIMAADIVRAARAVADPRNAFDLGYLMCPVAGVDAVLGKDFGCPDGDTPWKNPEAGTFDDNVVDGLLDQLGVTAPDEHTVVFQLSHPTSFWPDITALALLSPVSESSTSWNQAEEIVSSGPFVLSEWTHNHLMVLSPNSHWYGNSPSSFDRIEIRIGGDPAAALEAWEAGDLDEVRVPSSEISGVLATPQYASLLNRHANLAVQYWDFATCQAKPNPARQLCPLNDAVTTGLVGMTPFQNTHFRQALTQVIDKPDFIHETLAGIGQSAYSPTMPGIPGFPTVTGDNTPLPFDPPSALEKLALALDELGVAQPDAADVAPAMDSCDDDCQHTKAWAQGLGTMRFSYGCDIGVDSQVQYMAAHWRDDLGLRTTQFDLRCVDGSFGGFVPRTSYADVVRDGWYSDFPHPENANRAQFACDFPRRTVMHCNPAYDDLLDQGAGAATYADSLPFYHQAEQLLVEDAPVLFTRYGESVSLIRPWLAYTQSVSDQQNVGDAFYEDFQVLSH